MPVIERTIEDFALDAIYRAAYSIRKTYGVKDCSVDTDNKTGEADIIFSTERKTYIMTLKEAKEEDIA